MARPREFDMDVALERAMQAFWAKGYESTSMDDLCRATGLGKSSLYAAFRDKQSIYGLALERYEEAAVRRIRVAITQAPSVKAGLRQFLQQLVEDILAGPGRRGCFIGNCAAEVAKGDRAAAARVRRSLDRVETTFRDALLLGQAKGELSKSADVSALARFITAGIQGLRLVGKANPSREVLEDVAGVMLKCLE
jgi:TetR/AcrR family transcriptional regulator, transcriptional repressor for nem operon